jgi:hypothetical protein
MTTGCLVHHILIQNEDGMKQTVDKCQWGRGGGLHAYFAVFGANGEQLECAVIVDGRWFRRKSLVSNLRQQAIKNG